MEYKPQMVEIYGKDRGGLVHTSGKPQPQYKRVMAEELKEVADLITANTIFCTKEVLTSEEAAKYLGVSKSCLYKWTMSRQIPHYKSPTGKMCFFNRKEIEAWMQSQRVATEDDLQQQAQTLARKGGKK
jgi:excisionase family DNA binding protein